MSSAVGRLHSMVISAPVLRSSTSSRVSPHLDNRSSENSSLQQNDDISGVRNSDTVGFNITTQSNDNFAKIRASPTPRRAPTPPPPDMISMDHEFNSPTRLDDCDSYSSSSSSAVTKPSRVGSPPGFTIPVSEGITDDDIGQVDIFYRSRETQVFVCQSLTNMYLSASNPQQATQSSKITVSEWDFSQTGIPVLILNSGEHRRGRSLRIVLAEKGTGFPLWKDEITSQSQYKTPHANFHTLSISTDTTRLVGFSFDEADAAAKFADCFRELTVSSEEELANTGKKKPKKKKEKKPKFKPPKKIDISQPCCFVHITKLEKPDLIGGMFPPPPSGAELSHLGIPRATSESSGISEGSTNQSEH